ncbi:metallophosphoesterase family protein [Phreatobacter oligotrophus]|jgi:putative phosphoesterase|uniref:Putative phosphoesterase n=1 Tax=Phreatobacter oligotrophus TaxID=1122261 RepID=A0A2T4ZFN5_9HYPH|nr:metallophosphoesterase family protein [Phreatobacter oligotrophus]PTM60730.1 putative phosphoesterase [Phreatobacter oligotrophus]
MRLAAIADIHGNLLALDAVLADIAARGVDLTVNLGDCVSGPLWPAETAARLMALGLPTVRGNHDRWVIEAEGEALYFSDKLAREQLGEAQRAWLAGLPMSLDLNVGGVAVRLFHATPADDNTYLMEDKQGGRLVQSDAPVIRSRLGDLGGTRLVLCGHSHLPRLLTLDGLTVVNPGSVGQPAYSDPTPPDAHVSEAGSPHARYAIVTLRDGAVAAVDGIAVAYEWEAAARQAEVYGRAEWARGLRSGFVK